MKIKTLLIFEETLSVLYVTQWGLRLGWGLLLASAVALVVTFIHMPLVWKSDLDLTRKHPTATTVNLSDTDHTTALIKQIPGQHVFGNNMSGEAASAVPITSLQLHLVGIVMAEPVSLSRVIIAIKNQPGKVFQINDKVTAGVRIDSIVADGVILANGGHLEKLPLLRVPLEFKGMPSNLLLEN